MRVQRWAVAQVGVPGLHPALCAGCQSSSSPRSAEDQLHQHHSCPGAGGGHVNGRTLAFPAKDHCLPRGVLAWWVPRHKAPAHAAAFPCVLQILPGLYLGNFIGKRNPATTEMSSSWGAGLACVRASLPADAACHPASAHHVLCSAAWLVLAAARAAAPGEAQSRNPLPLLWFPYLMAALSSLRMHGGRS